VAASTSLAAGVEVADEQALRVIAAAAKIAMPAMVRFLNKGFLQLATPAARAVSGQKGTGSAFVNGTEGRVPIGGSAVNGGETTEV
jgi:hypothetical protein